MLAVVDTNVWISALLRVDGLAARLVDKIGPGGFQPVTCPSTLAELIRVSSQEKFAVQYPLLPAMLERIASGIGAHGVNIPEPPVTAICRDPKDDIFIALAVASAAPYLVSGDKDVHAANVVDYLRATGTDVLTVRQFLDALEQQEGEPNGSPSR